MDNVIESNGLTKQFGRKVAVNGLDLAVEQGSIFAFLGPNGAGKTTTIKMLMNMHVPTAGRVMVLGKDSRTLSQREFEQIGYVSENQKLPEWMTVRQLLNFCRPMYPTWDDDFCARMLKDFDLPPNAKLRHLSRGMKMKAVLLSSLAYRPRLLVLDEPFSGLDPLVRDEFIQSVQELTAQENWTVFVSSHDIDEVERLANWVGMINEGRLKLVESAGSLQARFRRVELEAPPDAPLPPLPPECMGLEREGGRIRFVDSAFNQPGREAFLLSQFPFARKLDLKPLSLRDIFLALARAFRFGKERAA
ncbi:MAG: ABC transporter ATP-binding protein [Kiritimatiellae bacterium]|nr:ABC transporter ATP-binding protein [Kiritimatiellia bacterium]